MLLLGYIMIAKGSATGKATWTHAARVACRGRPADDNAVQNALVWSSTCRAISHIPCSLHHGVIIRRQRRSCSTHAVRTNRSNR